MSAGTHYVKLVFLHLVGSAGHVMHSGASRVRKVDVVFFMLTWDRLGFHRNARRDTLRQTCVFASIGICRSRCAFQCIRV
jgi:hypothetical protein